MLAQSKIANLEASNKGLHVQLAKMHEELKKTEEARKAKERELLHQLLVLGKEHNEKLDNIANVINNFVLNFFSKLPLMILQPAKKACELITLTTYCRPQLHAAGESSRRKARTALTVLSPVEDGVF
jgi:hypothetical protein